VLVPARLWPRLAYPDKTQEQLYSKPPHFQILLKAPLKMGPRRLPARPRDRRPGSSRYNCVLCSIRRLHCHPDSSGVPAGRATARGAAIGAPTGRHPARQLRRSAVLKSLVGASFPKARPCGSHPRPSPRCSSPLPSPRGDCAGTLTSGSLLSATDGRHVSLMCSPTRTARPAQDFCASRWGAAAQIALRTWPRPRPRAMSSVARPAFTLRFCLR